MVREASFSWDLTDGPLDPLDRRESVLDDDLLVLKPPRRRRRRKPEESAESPATPRISTERRHLADAAWSTGDLLRPRRVNR